MGDARSSGCCLTLCRGDRGLSLLLVLQKVVLTNCSAEVGLVTVGVARQADVHERRGLLQGSLQGSLLRLRSLW